MEKNRVFRFESYGASGSLPLAPRCILIVSLALSWWSAGAQVDSASVSPAGRPGSPPAGLPGLHDRPDDVLDDDSLGLRLSEIEIERARLEVAETDFLHRLLPRVQFSASFGIHDLLFIDPATPPILPKDAYRLSVTLSLSGVFDFPKHRAAELNLDRLETEHLRMAEHQAASRGKLCRQLAGLADLLAALDEELTMRENVAGFNDLRFRQGKIGYDALVRSKLDVMTVRKSIFLLDREINEIRIRLDGGGEP